MRARGSKRAILWIEHSLLFGRMHSQGAEAFQRVSCRHVRLHFLLGVLGNVAFGQDNALTSDGYSEMIEPIFGSTVSRATAAQ